MTAQVIDIEAWQLVFGLIFILIAGAASLYHSLNLEKDLLVGALRTFAQLILLGYVLKFVFRINSPWLVSLLFLLMVVFAVRTIQSRIKERQVSFFWPVFFSMFLSYSLVSFMVTGVVVGAVPWWTPQYFIPLAGMVVGNSMNAIAISLERLFTELRGKRKEVEMMLSLGADYREASRDVLRNAMRAGMIPSINSMMAAGIVFIPGMMTGQILAGTDPLLAVRYQIVVMLMLVGSTALGSLLVTLITRRLCFDSAQRLRLRPQKKA